MPNMPPGTGCLLSPVYPVLLVCFQFETPRTVAYQAPMALQARTLEWVAISFSRESSQSRDWTRISYIGRWILHLQRSLNNNNKRLQFSSVLFCRFCCPLNIYKIISSLFLFNELHIELCLKSHNFPTFYKILCFSFAKCILKPMLKFSYIDAVILGVLSPMGTGGFVFEKNFHILYMWDQY